MTLPQISWPETLEKLLQGEDLSEKQATDLMHGWAVCMYTVCMYVGLIVF